MESTFSLMQHQLLTSGTEILLYMWEAQALWYISLNLTRQCCFFIFYGLCICFLSQQWWCCNCWVWNLILLPNKIAYCCLMDADRRHRILSETEDFMHNHISIRNVCVSFPWAVSPLGLLWRSPGDACTCIRLHPKRGTLSLGTQPFYSMKGVSLLFVLESDTSLPHPTRLLITHAS